MTSAQVILRKFPYPFKCALTICSDLDATDTIERYITLQKYICGCGKTPLGEGLNLETGNSFWFFRNSTVPGFSYFKDLKGKKSKESVIIYELIRSGHIDVLHTYGDFNNGGFKRHMAEKCLHEVEKLNVKLSVWVNHGSSKNSQSIGSLPGYGGDDPESPFYHMDIAKAIGLRYYWISQLTHLVGHDSRPTFNNLVKTPMQRIIALKNRGKQIDPFFDNSLMKKVKLRDGSRINAFVRYINPWGKYSYTDINNIPFQINSKVLDELQSSEGYMVLYTHLGNNDRSSEILPHASRITLESLAERVSSGKIFVAATSRILKYYEVSRNLKYRTVMNDKRCDIHIEKNKITNSADCLSGLTFYKDKSRETRLFFDHKEIPLITNPPDETGRTSVSVTWPKLQFPL